MVGGAELARRLQIEVLEGAPGAELTLLATRHQKLSGHTLRRIALHSLCRARHLGRRALRA
jgi:hypothetical protein